MVCFSFIIRHNDYHGNKYLTASNFIAGNIDAVIHGISQYFGLRETNERLAAENAKLKNELQQNKHYFKSRYYLVDDKFRKQKYVYTAAKVINSTIIKPKNFFTINKGRNHGIEMDMAVVSPEGVAGIVFDVSNNFATVMSVINTNFKVGAKLKDTDYFGSLSWNGLDYRTVQLSEIPIHVPVEIGDTVITNGFSALYPGGVMIGTISGIDKSGGENFYNINVQLATDYKKIEFVYIINDLYKKERLSLENKLQND